MEQSDIVIHNSKCAVLGFGRCGKAISKILKGVGADVHVTYRNKSDAAMIATNNYKPIEFKNLKQSIKKFNFIFNTIPSQILNKSLLSDMNKKTIIIDVAQAPGGVDYAVAKEKNIKAVFCPGLPGIVAPETAAKIIKESVFSILEEGDIQMG